MYVTALHHLVQTQYALLKDARSNMRIGLDQQEWMYTAGQSLQYPDEEVFYSLVLAIVKAEDLDVGINIAGSVWLERAKFIISEYQK